MFGLREQEVLAYMGTITVAVSSCLGRGGIFDELAVSIFCRGERGPYKMNLPDIIPRSLHSLEKGKISLENKVMTES